MESDLTPKTRSFLEMIEEARRAVRPLAQTEVPEDVLQSVRNLFESIEPAQVLSLPALLCRMISDPAPTPALGFRAAPSPRQRVFEAEGFTVQLREEPLPQAGVALTGQVSAVAAAVAGLPVLVLSGRRVLARSRTNENGEFQLDADSSRKLRIVVAVEEATRKIELPL